MPDDVKPASTWLPAEVYEDLSFCAKYVIERELGVGGSGVVVGARHRELDERVAIKFLLPERQSSAAVARFRREARAATRIKNEHVVRIFDVSTTETGIPYIVMEYLDGIDLERMLLQSPHHQLPIRDAVEFVLQVCEVLAECHSIGIVHRDLKPSNLFLVHGADGLPAIKVLDFGISKLGPAVTDQLLTGEHTIVGSPRYMSPEQFDSSRGVDQRADIWSLGVILHELVTGEAPFADDSLMKIWKKVESESPPALETLRRDAPRELTPVVSKCLAKDPADRYSNVAELAKELLPFAPERARLSVERIVRILEAPGATTGELNLEPVSQPGISEVPTVESAQPDTRTVREPRLPLRRVASALGALTLVAVVGTELGAPDTPQLPTVLRRPALPQSFESARSEPSAVPEPRRPASHAAAEPSSPNVLARDAGHRTERAPGAVVDAAVAQRPARAASRPAPAVGTTAARVVPPESEPEPEPASVVPALASGALEPAASAAPLAGRAQPGTASSANATRAAPPAPRFLIDIVEQRKPRHTGN